MQRSQNDIDPKTVQDQGEERDPGQQPDKKSCQGRGGSLAPVTYAAPKERNLKLRKPRVEHSKHLSLTSNQFCGHIYFLVFNKQGSVIEKCSECSIIPFYLLYAEIVPFLFCKLCKQTDSEGREDDIWNSKKPVASYSIFMGKFWSYLNHQEGFMENLHTTPPLPHPYTSTRQNICWIPLLKWV